MAGTVLSRDSIVSFERWDAPQMDVVVTPDEPEAPPPGPTVFELEEIERHAREDGYAAGLAEGRLAAKSELKEQLARLETLCFSAARPLDDFDRATERELARLAIVMARRVVARELQTDPSLIELGVREAVASLPSATRELRIRVHPDDLDFLRELDASEPHWRFDVDPSLTRGDCVLESKSSRLDSRIDTRLAAVIDAVLGSEIDDGNDEVVA